VQRAALLAEGPAADADAPPETCELRVRRPDGSVRVCEVRVVASPGDADQPPVLHGALLDVTERREADAERRALDARLLETQRLETIGVLAGGIAHDFNNLLTSMLGNADLLRAGLRAGTPEHQLAGEVLLAGRRSADLTRQLLAYAGHASYVVRPLDLGALAREVTGLLRTALPPGGALRLEAKASAARVTGDRAQLTQVLVNLVTNAAEALMAGGGEVRVRVCALGDGDPAAPGTLAPGPCVRVEVEDTGAGMSEATQARMFEPFFSTKGAGRGLGLAATQGIVRAHRGALSVRSAPGAGTTVAVWLPDAGASDAEPLPAAGERARPSRLLVVDDDPAVRATLARMLRRLGHEVLEAGAGAAALEALEGADAIDLAIVDLSMPDARGEATAARLEDARPGLPVLITSGYWDGEGAHAAGRRALAKPYDLERLGRVVDDALRP
jgi:signal transduction histidine kinase/CheY-like chemotaxis protein